jgi:hypothetical protein
VTTSQAQHKNNPDKDATLHCVRLGSIVLWARSKRSNEAAHQPPFLPFSINSLRVVRATIKKVSISG